MVSLTTYWLSVCTLILEWKHLTHETKSNSQDVIVQETQKKTMELETTEVY